MRRSTAIIAAASLALVALASTASASSPWDGCPVGPVGAGGSSIAGWEFIDEADLADAVEAAGFDPAEVSLVFAKEDRNEDGTLCVMVQTLPNDASGSDTWFVTKDNNARR